MWCVVICGPNLGNWPKNINAIAIEILSPKCNAIVIMHHFYKKSNAIVEVIAIELLPKIAPFFLKLFKDFESCQLSVLIYFLFWVVNGFMISDADYFENVPCKKSFSI